MLILAGLALLVDFNLILLANADTCIGGGALSITASPGVANFPAVSVSTTAQTNNVSFPNSLSFEDMRGVNAPFTLTVSATDFANSTLTASFAVANLEMASDVTDTITQVDCDPSTGITLDNLTTSAFIDTNLDGLSDDKGLVSGDTRVRVGKYAIIPEMDLTIPARTPNTSFSTTITFSIQ